MKVRRREHGLRVAVNRHRPVVLVNEHVVVHAEVGVVEVFVLATDLYGATVGQKGQRLAEPLRAPNRFRKRTDRLLEPSARLIRRGPTANHGFPKRDAHPFWITLAEVAGERALKIVRRDRRQRVVTDGR